ncbi:MAG: DUF4214 domain-containing protein [Paracoccaceae bacterium]
MTFRFVVPEGSAASATDLDGAVVAVSSEAERLASADYFDGLGLAFEARSIDESAEADPDGLVRAGVSAYVIDEADAGAVPAGFAVLADRIEPVEGGVGETDDPNAFPIGGGGGSDDDGGAGDDAVDLADARLVALLYEAALDRDGAIDEEGLNFWIDEREDGLSETALAQAFLDSEEFADVVGDPATLDDDALVRALYLNVLGREGDAGGVDFWTDALAGADFGRDDLLLAFASSTENRTLSDVDDRLIEIADGVFGFVDEGDTGDDADGGADPGDGTGGLGAPGAGAGDGEAESPVDGRFPLGGGGGGGAPEDGDDVDDFVDGRDGDDPGSIAGDPSGSFDDLVAQRDGLGLGGTTPGAGSLDADTDPGFDTGPDSGGGFLIG